MGETAELAILFESVEDGTNSWQKVSESSERYESAYELATAALADKDDVELATSLFEYLDTRTRITRSISADTDGVFALSGTSILYNGNALHETLSRHIIQMMNSRGLISDQLAWNAFAKFVENLQQNLYADVRDQLFSWMQTAQDNTGSFTITSDGHFVAYRGVMEDADGVLRSRQSGNASVLDATGEVTDYTRSQIPNVVGTTVFMPRDQVTADPRVGCAAGLHVATIEYAQSWAPTVIAVKVNPKDVVSVPYECDAQKVRVARYKVIEVVQEAYDSQLFTEQDVDFDEPEDDDDVECECYLCESDPVDPRPTADDVRDATRSASNAGTYRTFDEAFGKLMRVLYNQGVDTGWPPVLNSRLTQLAGHPVSSRSDLTLAEVEAILDAIG